MKRTMVVAVLSLLVGTGLSQAQMSTMTFTGKLLNPDRTGPMQATHTHQIDRTLQTDVEQLGGGLAHLDIVTDTSTGDAIPVSVEVYDRNGTHVLSCPNLVLIATENTSQADTYSDKFKMVATCNFTPEGEGGEQGIGYIMLSGTSTIHRGTGIDLKLTVTGSLGGGVNADVNKLVTKGSFGSVLKPPVE